MHVFQIRFYHTATRALDSSGCVGVFCMHLAHVLRMTDSLLAMVYLLPIVLKSVAEVMGWCVIKARRLLISAGFPSVAA